MQSKTFTLRDVLKQMWLMGFYAAQLAQLGRGQMDVDVAGGMDSLDLHGIPSDEPAGPDRPKFDYCPKCGRRFLITAAMDQHLRYVHRVDPVTLQPLA